MSTYSTKVTYSASSTPPSARMVSRPLAYITEEMEQNTPMGVKYITTEMILMEMSLTASTTFTKGSAFSFSARQVMPTMMANTSTCSMSPLTKEAMGLAGIRFFTVSSRLVKRVASTVVSIIWISTPLPRPSASGRNRPRSDANSVVPTKNSTV